MVGCESSDDVEDGDESDSKEAALSRHEVVPKVTGSGGVDGCTADVAVIPVIEGNDGSDIECAEALREADVLRGMDGRGKLAVFEFRA